MSYGYGGGYGGGHGGGYGGGGYGGGGGYSGFGPERFRWQSSANRYQDSLINHPAYQHRNNPYRGFNSFQNARRYQGYYDDEDDGGYMYDDDDDDDDESYGSDLADTGGWNAPDVDFWRMDRADPLMERNLRRIPQATFDIQDEEWVDEPRVMGHSWERRRREDFGSWGDRWGRY